MSPKITPLPSVLMSSTWPMFSNTASLLGDKLATSGSSSLPPTERALRSQRSQGWPSSPLIIPLQVPSPLHQGRHISIGQPWATCLCLDPWIPDWLSSIQISSGEGNVARNFRMLCG